MHIGDRLAVLGSQRSWDAKDGLQGGNVPIGIGNDGVVHNAAGGICLDVSNPPTHKNLLQPC